MGGWGGGALGPGARAGVCWCLAELGRPIGYDQIEVQQAAPGVTMDAVEEEVAHGAADQRQALDTAFTGGGLDQGLGHGVGDGQVAVSQRHRPQLASR